MLRQQHDTAERRKDLIGLCENVFLVRCSEVCKTSELPGKVLIVAVRSCGYSVLLRGLQNLETPCKGERIVTFCIVQKVTKKHAGLRPATSIQIAGRYMIVVKVTGIHQVTGYAENCKSPGIAGNDLNRCEVPALQRKNLERRSKE